MQNIRSDMYVPLCWLKKRERWKVLDHYHIFVGSHAMIGCIVQSFVSLWRHYNNQLKTIEIYNELAWHHESLRARGAWSYHRRGCKGFNNSAFEQFGRILDIDYAVSHSEKVHDMKCVSYWLLQTSSTAVFFKKFLQGKIIFVGSSVADLGVARGTFPPPPCP